MSKTKKSRGGKSNSKMLKTIFGVIFIIGGMANFGESNEAALFGIVAGCLLIAWAFERNHSPKGSAPAASAVPVPAVPDSPKIQAKAHEKEIANGKVIFEKETKDSNGRILSCPHTSPYVIVDVETTGLNPSKDKIIQISAIRYDLSGNVVDAYDTYINPGIPIPPTASQINHITDAIVSDAPCAEDVKDHFLDFLSNDLIVGYNTTFDLRFLNNTFSGILAGREYVDVLKIARANFSLPSYRLEAVAQTVGHRSTSYHNSLIDCEAVAAVLRYANENLSDWTETFLLQKPQETVITRYDDFYKGLKFYSDGEQARLIGDFDKALELFGKARDVGYNMPAIYSSYAILYRKQKEYQKEIDILDEGIKALSDEQSKELRYRKARAMQLLQAQKDKQEEERLRAQKKAEREVRKQMEAEAKAMRQPQNTSRPILQMSDDGTLLNRYESVALASRSIGINEKSIRCAANGQQKHAGGYCWKYEDTPAQ